MNIADFLNYVEPQRRSGRGWIAKCPAHSDKIPSLSIAEGDNGNILLKCFAGCATEEVVAALGLKMSDLFADAASPRDMIRRRTLKQKQRRAALGDAMVQGVYREAEVVLRAATGVDISNWTASELDAAMSAVCTAHEVLQKEREAA